MSSHKCRTVQRICSKNSKSVSFHRQRGRSVHCLGPGLGRRCVRREEQTVSKTSQCVHRKHKFTWPTLAARIFCSLRFHLSPRRSLGAIEGSRRSSQVTLHCSRLNHLLNLFEFRSTHLKPLRTYNADTLRPCGFRLSGGCLAQLRLPVTPTAPAAHHHKGRTC
jgi:hypothetical protein